MRVLAFGHCWTCGVVLIVFCVSSFALVDAAPGGVAPGSVAPCDMRRVVLGVLLANVGDVIVVNLFECCRLP